MNLPAQIANRLRGLTLREKSLAGIAALAAAWICLDSAAKPMIAAYAQRRDSIAYLESEKERIARPLAGLPELIKKLATEKEVNLLLRERILKLSERFRSSGNTHGAGLEFLQSILSGSNLSAAEVNISSELLKRADTSKTERMPAPPQAHFTATRIDDEFSIIRSRIVFKAEAGFRELAALLKRVESARLPLIMRRMEVAADTPGNPRALKMELEMDVFSL